MGPIRDQLRTRLVPAVLMAGGVMLLTAGLLTYTDPTIAAPPGAGPTPVMTATPAVAPSPPAPIATPTPTPRPAGSPSGSPAPSGPPADRVATRVVVPALRIDLAVIRPPDEPDHYPFCNVAEYLTPLSQPGFPGATYIYAHARTGMFLPLLETRAARLKGMIVQVFTSDDRLFLYEIVEVRRNQFSLDDAIGAVEPQLWLQTSEGPNASFGKTMVIAMPIDEVAADPAEAHPAARPVRCG